MDHETIHYDSSVILTSDDVADAVIEYAAALSGGDRADTVEVPPGDRYGIPRSWLLRRTLGSFPAMLTGLRSSIGHLAPSLVCTTATR